jgi:hypothetical protein
MARLLPCGGLARFVLPVLVAGAALVGATGASAGPAITSNTPFTFAGTNSCVFPAEEFMGSGHIQMLASDNESNSGNVQFHLEGNFAGLQAVTTFPLAVAGKKYVVVDEEDLLLTFVPDGASHQTLEVTFKFVRSGEDGTPLTTGDDFFVHFLAHATVNANGVPTVEDLKTDDGCR